MDIHKPKRWRGGREFLKEYLIIVIGVLTALAGEQTVEWLHNGAELDEARHALKAEVALDAGQLAYAAQEDRCFLAAMDGYTRWSKGGPKSPDVIAAVGLPGFAATVWEQVESGPVTRMPLKERLAYADFYSNGANLLTLVAEDRSVAREIARATAGGALDREDAKALRQAASVRRFLQIKIQASQYMLGLARDLGVTPAPRPAEATQQLEKLCQMVGLTVTD